MIIDCIIIAICYQDTNILLYNIYVYLYNLIAKKKKKNHFPASIFTSSSLYEI